MGFTEVDQKAINTIRLLAVCFLPLPATPPLPLHGSSSYATMNERAASDQK